MGATSRGAWKGKFLSLRNCISWKIKNFFFKKEDFCEKIYTDNWVSKNYQSFLSECVFQRETYTYQSSHLLVCLQMHTITTAGQHKFRSQELNPDLPCRWQGPAAWNINCCLAWSALAGHWNLAPESGFELRNSCNGCWLVLNQNATPYQNCLEQDKDGLEIK